MEIYEANVLKISYQKISYLVTGRYNIFANTGTNHQKYVEHQYLGSIISYRVNPNMITVRVGIKQTEYLALNFEVSTNKRVVQVLYTKSVYDLEENQ